MPADFKITTELLYKGALIFALMDVIYIPILVWRVSEETFRRLKWSLVIASALVWHGIWAWAIGNYWETVYSYVFPAWAQTWIPGIAFVVAGSVALGLWLITIRLKRKFVLTFCLMGGVIGSVTHIWAVYRGIVTKPPMLQGASPPAGYKFNKVALMPENRIIKLAWWNEKKYWKTGGSMTKNIGLWIDHKKAIIVVQSEQGEDIQKIESGVGRHVRYRGASHPKSPYSAQYQQGDNQLDNRYLEQLNKFYDKVIAHIRAADAVLIFGPGEAKVELEKRIAHEKVKAQIVGVETADKLTDRQITSKVRIYFEEARIVS